MSWAGISSNQTVTLNNLQDAVNNGVFASKSYIPSGNRCLTKYEVDLYVRIDTTFPSYANKSSNQLIYKSDLSAQTGVVFVPSYGLYPVSGTSSTVAGTLYNYQSNNIWVKGLFNSGGSNTGDISNNRIYFNYPVDNPTVPTEYLYFYNIAINSYGQSVYTNRNSDQIYPGDFSLPGGWSANITIDKFDGIGSGSTLRLAYSNTQHTGPFTVI